MEREAILQVLQAHPDNCIRAFHRSRAGCAGRIEGRQLVRHYGGLIPDEIVLKLSMFLKVQDQLEITERWGNEMLGGCTWKLMVGKSNEA